MDGVLIYCLVAMLGNWCFSCGKVGGTEYGVRAGQGQGRVFFSIWPSGCIYVRSTDESDVIFVLPLWEVNGFGALFDGLDGFSLFIYEVLYGV